MSPRKPIRTAKHEKAMQSALKKVEKGEKRKGRTGLFGARVRRGQIDNA